MHTFDEPYAILRKGEFYAALTIRAGAEGQASILCQCCHKRTGQRLSFEEQPEPRLCTEGIRLRNQLQPEAEWLVVTRWLRSLRDNECLRATREDFAVGFGRLATLGAHGQNGVEPLLPQVVLELARVELQGIRLAAVADDRRSGGIHTHVAGGILILEAGHRMFAAGVAHDKPLDLLGASRHRIPEEVLADAEAGHDRLADGRLERRRLDPEIVGQRRQRKKGDEAEENVLHAFLYGPAGRVDGRTAAFLLAQQAMSSERPRALVVDDDEPIRSMLGRIVEHQGFTVDTARDGAEAIERMSHDGYNVVLLDLMMPKVDGYGVLNWMRAERPDLIGCTIVASAVPEREIVRQLVDNVYKVHPKPFDMTQLIEDVRRCAKKNGKGQAGGS